MLRLGSLISFLIRNLHLNYFTGWLPTLNMTKCSRTIKSQPINMNCVCVNTYNSFQSIFSRVLENLVPVLSFKDLAVDGSPSLSKDVQLLFKQGSIRWWQLPHYLLSSTGEPGHNRLVAGKTLSQLLESKKKRTEIKDFHIYQVECDINQIWINESNLLNFISESKCLLLKI